MSGNTYWRLTQFTNPNNGSSITFTAAHNIYIDENGVAYIFGAHLMLEQIQLMEQYF